jgi:protein gp37
MSDLFHEAVPDEWIDRIFAVMALCPQHTFIVVTKRSARMREYLSPPLMRLGTTPGRIGRHLHALASASKLNDVYVWLAQDRLIAWPLPNVWALVSVEDQTTADRRIPDLLATPAAVHGASYEPALGPVDLGSWTWHPAARADNSPGLDWVIVGGESGPSARPIHPDWARSVRDQCQAGGVAFFFKQWGEWAPQRAAGIYEGRARLNYSDGTCVIRIGKRAAGRLLDGRTWDEYPEAKNG